MSQALPDLINQLSASLRTNLNLSLKAINSLNSGPTEPTYSYANMLWYDTVSTILKMKPEDNAAGQWISIGYLDQSTDTFKILDDTVVTTAAGVDTNGIIGDQATATWETGTGTTESLVSPAKVKAAVEALSPTPQNLLGVNQTWSVVARTSGTSYRNTTGRPIQINVNGAYSGGGYIDVSTNNSTWVRIWTGSGQANTWGAAIIPDDHYYKVGSNDEVAILS